jgi:hypothetical protein
MLTLINPVRRAELFDHPDWVFEAKFDGLYLDLDLKGLEHFAIQRVREASATRPWSRTGCG